jgi:hypothetical protein
MADDEPWVLALAPLTAVGLGPAALVEICPSADAESFDPDDGLAVHPNPTVTTPPVLVSVTASDGLASASWTAPDDDGRVAIVAYEIEATSVDEVVTVRSTDLVNLTATVGPLVNGVEYTVVVRAINELGTSLPSNTLTVTPQEGLAPVAPLPALPEPPPPKRRRTPVIYAFPPDYLFRPDNWLLTPEEAAVAEAEELARRGGSGV